LSLISSIVIVARVRFLKALYRMRIERKRRKWNRFRRLF
jgi:hypothetical protein